jgi:hypothetical protein
MKAIVITIVACATAIICAVLLRDRLSPQPRYQLYGVEETSGVNQQNVKLVYRLDTISGKTWRMTMKPIFSPPDAQHDKPSILTWAEGWEEMSEIDAAIVKAKTEYQDAIEFQKGWPKPTPNPQR